MFELARQESKETGISLKNSKPFNRAGWVEQRRDTTDLQECVTWGIMGGRHGGSAKKTLKALHRGEIERVRVPDEARQHVAGASESCERHVRAHEGGHAPA